MDPYLIGSYNGKLEPYIPAFLYIVFSFKTLHTHMEAPLYNKTSKQTNKQKNMALPN